ncbi:helix-turn-helix transcriptional regulator [Sphingomonas profundi]|uniref:helix-turn-helix transcriptional regulator n=1 Tax=Alterirhizorhabdus profundi TaxID=2681549 RepID=UPI0012E79268|nr:AraC family transcriptional regulator [Sphingomonas profundi]
MRGAPGKRGGRDEALRQSVSRRRFGGLSVERVIYEWSAGQPLEDIDADLTFKLVAGHHPVRARCWNPDGKAEAVGRLILTPPNGIAKGYGTEDESGIRSTVFHLDGALIERALRQSDMPVRLADLEIDLDVRDTNIESVLLRLASEVEGEGLGSEMLVEALVQMLIVDLARHVASGREALSVSGGLKASQIKHIEDFLDSFEIGLPTPAEVASECGMSPTHLRRLFKRATGESLQNYLKAKRISRARALLADEDIPLKVVSYRLGFNHCSAFSFAFQQATGETPGQYRRRRAMGLTEASLLDAAAFAAIDMGRC